jgi:hypothetical protein
LKLELDVKCPLSQLLLLRHNIECLFLQPYIF